MSIFWISLLVIGMDQTVKFLTFQYLSRSILNAYPYGGIPVFSDILGIQFSLNYVANKGAIGGLFADFQDYLLALRIVLILALVTYLYFYRLDKNLNIPLALIIGGAIGNIIDYFIYGHVVDMFHFVLWGFDYPVFNVADAAICIGIGWIFLKSKASSTKPSRKANQL